ncbi:myosin-crossreactive antigen [Kitasatospora sp. MAP12-15]|nr:myosin-crossreactive antigen [Kitasatospora sp. MAP12-44]
MPPRSRSSQLTSPSLPNPFIPHAAPIPPDRPAEASALAFIGQFAEVPDDVVFTVEYSVRTAWTAVAQLLKLDRQPPPVYKGQHDPRVLVHALQTMHRR